MNAGLHKQPSNHEDIFLRRDVALTKYQVQQLALLYLALQKLLHKPIVECWIYFLALEHSWGLEFNSTDQGPSFENNSKRTDPQPALASNYIHRHLLDFIMSAYHNDLKLSYEIQLRIHSILQAYLWHQIRSQYLFLPWNGSTKPKI